MLDVSSEGAIYEKEEGEQKVFCSPSSGHPNPRRLTSATPIRGISRPGAVPSGLLGQPPLLIINIEVLQRSI